MRKIVLAVVVFWIAAGASAFAQNAADDRGTLKRLSVELMDAVERKDRATLEKLLAPDYQLVSIGELEAGVNRSEWLANALRMDWANRGYSDVRVDIEGDVGIVTSNYAFRIDPGGWKPAVSATSPLVDVWVRRDGRWQIQRRHLGGNSLTRWADRVLGFVVGLLVLGSGLLLRRAVRRRRDHAV
jgi:ketosteroid isomerase-like protein